MITLVSESESCQDAEEHGLVEAVNGVPKAPEDAPYAAMSVGWSSRA
jgi:hypothetical protein